MMKKHFTKFIAAVLCLLMLLTIAPTAEFAGTLFKAFAEDTYKTAVKVYSDAKIVENTTQFRYRVRADQVSTATSITGWSRISEAEPLFGDWSAEKSTTTQPTASDTLQITRTETATRYRYYHYVAKSGGTTYWHFCPQQGKNYNGVTYSKAYSSWYSSGNRLSGTTHSQGHDSGVGGATTTKACSYCGLKAGTKPKKYTASDGTPYYAEESQNYTAKWYYKTRTKTLRYNYRQYTDYSPWSYTEISSLDELSFERQDGVTYTLETESRPVAIDEYGVIYSEDMTKIYYVPEVLQTECFNIPTTVKEIYDAAFYNCAGIKEIIIPVSVTKIDANAFNNCTAMESIIIPEKVTSIGNGAFANCSALGSVFFKAEAPITLGTDCFTYTAIDCFYVYFLEFKDAWLPYESSWNGYPLKGYNPPGERYSNIDANGTDSQGFTYSLNASNKTATITAYSGGANVVFPKRVIKDSVEYSVNAFATNAFKGKTNITKVSMSKKITSIPANAFDGCTGLTEISYNGSFNSIGEYAFRNCSNLKYFSYLKGLTSIAKGAFYNCSKLIDISIPSGVKTIGESAFYGCAKIGNLVIPSSVTSIGASAFYGCTAMAMVTFEGAPNIGANAFANCTALIKAKFKNNPSSTVGSGAFSGNSTFGVEYPTNNNSWKSQVSNYSWKGYKALSADVVKKVGINAYVIQVVSPKGKTLPYESIKLAGQSAMTDEYGNAYFTKPSAKTVSLWVGPKEIEYDEYTTSSYSVKKTPCDVIKLAYAKGSVSGVKFNDNDIKSGKAVINTNYEVYSVLTVYVSAPQKITKIEVLSGNSVVSSKQNVAAGRKNISFNIKNGKLTPGKAIKVRMTLANGDVSYSDALKIVPFKGLAHGVEVGNSFDKDNKGEYGFDLSASEFSALSKIKIKIPAKSIMSFLSFQMLNKEDSMSIGLNYEPTGDLVPESTLVKKAKTLAQKESTKKVGISSGLCGVINIGFNPNKSIYYIKSACVKAFVKVTANFGATVSILSVPVRIELDLEGKFTITINLESKNMDQGFKAGMLALRMASPDTDLDFSVKLSAGVGCAAASIGIFGSYELNWQILKGKVFGTGKFGGYAKVLCVRKEVVLVNTKKKQLYPRTKRTSAPALNDGYLDDLYNIELFMPIDRDYLETRSEWLSGMSSRQLAKAKAGNIENTAELATLQTSVYDYVEPKIITCNGTTMMVYADDMASRGQNNLQALVYSIYNPATGVWSVPQKIDNNDTLDNNFDLYSDGTRIYVVYSEANNTFGDNAELEEISAATDISIASYDTNTGRFDKVESINHDNIYDMTPVFAIIDNIPTAVWVRNTGNNVFGMDNSNEIVYSKYINGAWSAPSVLVASMPQVTSVAVGNLNGTAYVAATSDADNNPDTQDDNKLVLADFNGSIKEVETGINNNANAQFVSYKGTNTLIWSNNGQVLSLANGASVPTALIASEDYAVDPNFGWVDCNNGKYAVTFVSASEEEGSNVYTVYYDGSEWTNPIKVTNTDKYVGAYDVAYVNNMFVVPYRDTTVTFSETEDTFSTSANLCAAYISPVADAYVADAILDRQSLAFGEQANMTLNIFNNGFNDLDDARITIKNAAGATVFTTTENVQIASGEDKDVDVTFTAPAAVEEGLYQIFVEDASGANKAELKAYEIDLWQSDLCVEAEQLILGEENSLIVNVTNDGFVPSAAGQLKVATGTFDSAAEPFATIDVESIEPGATNTYLVELNDDIYTNDETSGIVTAWITTEGTDAVESNDYSTVSIVRFEEDEGYDEDEVVKFAPDLSVDTISVDLAAMQDAQIAIERNGNAFSSVKDLAEGTQYSYTDDTLTLKQAYLSSLEQGIHEIELLFNEGLDNEYVATVIITVTDSTSIPITGTVSVEGEPVFGNTLSINPDDIEPLEAEYTIEWKREGTVVGTDSTYEIQSDDIGKSITASIAGTNGYSGTVSSGPVIPSKADGATLLSPVLLEANYTSISLMKYEGYEYKCNDGEWTTLNVFENLAPNTEYSFRVRKAETATHTTGAVSEIAKFSTKPIPLESLIVINGTPERGKTLTAVIVSQGSETYTYQWYRNDAAIQGATGTNYTTTVADVNCDITVKATASGSSVGEITSPSVKVVCVHEYTWTTTKQPSCEKAGQKIGTCVCGSTKSETISALGHNKDSNGKCIRCGKQIDPPPNSNVCKWCGKVHKGFFQMIVGFFHRIFAAIFGAKY